MSQSEVEKSEIVISKILKLLMEWGLQDCQLEFEELDLEPEYGKHFFACINWLVDEGIIRVGDICRYTNSREAGVVTNPVLTAFGFKVMGQNVKIGETEMVVSEAVEHVSASNEGFTKAGNFSGGLLASFMQSFG